MYDLYFCDSLIVKDIECEWFIKIKFKVVVALKMIFYFSVYMKRMNLFIYLIILLNINCFVFKKIIPQIKNHCKFL